MKQHKSLSYVWINNTMPLKYAIKSEL